MKPNPTSIAQPAWCEGQPDLLLVGRNGIEKMRAPTNGHGKSHAGYFPLARAKTREILDKYDLSGLRLLESTFHTGKSKVNDAKNFGFPKGQPNPRGVGRRRFAHAGGETGRLSSLDDLPCDSMLIDTKRSFTGERRANRARGQCSQSNSVSSASSCSKKCALSKSTWVHSTSSYAKASFHTENVSVENTAVGARALSPRSIPYPPDLLPTKLCYGDQGSEAKTAGVVRSKVDLK